MKLYSRSKKKKDASKSLTKEGNLEHSASGADSHPTRPETVPKPDPPALKVDVGANENRFEPSFDPYLDGDKGDVNEAMKYLAAKALGNSAQHPASPETPEKTVVKGEEPSGQSAMPANPEVPKATHADGELSDVDLLRVRLWRARASHSRQAGLSLVMLSAALFAGAFYTSALILEVGSVSSFVMGVGLLAYEAEPRVKLFPSTSSLIGPLKAVESDLEAHGVSKVQAVFERSPSGEGEVMSFDGAGESAPRYSIPPLGEGLVHSYELELGDLARLETDGAKVWLPRVMVDGLGLADRVKMSSSGYEVTTVIEKPFVRALCVQDFMAESLCQTVGCPLAASVGQALSRASGRPVTHHGCRYDPVTQKATLVDEVAQ